MPYDELLRLLGSVGAGTIGSDPEADLSATGSGSARYVGPNRGYRATLRVGGDVTGTTPTLDMRIQTSANGTSGWTTVATFTQVTDEMVGYMSGTTPRYEVPGEDPLSAIFETGSRPYARVDYTLAGTTPVFNDVSVELTPISGYASKRSGS